MSVAPRTGKAPVFKPEVSILATLHGTCRFAKHAPRRTRIGLGYNGHSPGRINANSEDPLE